MATSGDNRVPQVNSTLKYVQDLFQAEKDKKLSEKQVTDKIRAQNESQRNLQQSLETQQRQHEPKSKDDEKRTPQSLDRDYSNVAHSTESKAEKNLDAFLVRNTNIQNLKDAGRDLSRAPTWSSLTPQAWSVLNSNQLSTEARRIVLAKHLEKKSTPLPSTTTSTSNLTTPEGKATVRESRQASPNTTTHDEMDLPREIQYHGPLSNTGGYSSLRSMGPQYALSERIFQQLAKLFTLQSQTSQGSTQAAPVLVHLRLPLVFIKDHDKTRLFRLNDDGTLEELPSEHASDSPLSPEAQAELRRVLKQKLSTRDHHGQDAMSPESLAELMAGGQDPNAEKPNLDFETRFSLLLYQVLEEHYPAGTSLDKDEQILFPEKKDWEAFFANMMKVGNQEKTNKKSMDDILGFIFRGLFKKQGGLPRLVGDLQYLKDGKTRTEKFAQIPLEEAAWLNIFEQLLPGQSLTAKQLRQMFEEELEYLRMAHQQEKVFNMADKSERNVTFNPKAAFDPYSQARLESSIFSKYRRKTISDEAPLLSLPLQTIPPNFLANTYELLGLRQLRDGHPKIFTLLMYLIFGGLIGLALGFGLWKLL